MRTITKKPSWKHITFMTPKIAFMQWSKKGINVILQDKEYKFENKRELEALHMNLNPSYHGEDTCWISINELKSIYNKSKRMKQIELLNGKAYDKDKLLEKMYDDSFYYGELGKYALSSSAIKSLLDSPKEYARALNYKSDNRAFKQGRLIHLAALEPDKIDTLCHVVEVQSAVSKAYKDKVKEVGSADFVFTRKDYDKAMYTVDALLQNDVWQQLTRDAKFEQPGFDILHGYPFRAKADVLGKNYIADLKTTSDLKAFKWSAIKYNYDVQVYIYCKLFNITYDKFVFFAIDKSSGDLGIYDITERFYNSGKDKVQYALKIFEQYFIKKQKEINEYVIKDTIDIRD
jgi:hypothetical protein